MIDIDFEDEDEGEDVAGVIADVDDEAYDDVADQILADVDEGRPIVDGGGTGYLAGCDILGAEVVPGRALLIRLRDVPGLVKKQGGSTGAFANMLVPQTIENTVYSRMAQQMAGKLKEQGVDADVSVVEPNGYHSAGSSPLWKPLALGLGATTLGASLLWFFKWRKRR